MVDTLSGTTPLFLYGLRPREPLTVVRCSKTWRWTMRRFRLWIVVSKRRQSWRGEPCIRQAGRIRSARPFEEFTLRPKLWTITLEGKSRPSLMLACILKKKKKETTVIKSFREMLNLSPCLPFFSLVVRMGVFLKINKWKFANCLQRDCLIYLLSYHRCSHKWQICCCSVFAPYYSPSRKEASLVSGFRVRQK